MRCPVTKNPLPAIWRHPDLPGQYVAGFTRKDAYYIVLLVTERKLDIDKFSRTGKFAWREMIMSTPEALEQNTV